MHASGSSGHSYHSFDVDALMRPPEDEPILTSVERTSADRRRVYRDVVPVAPPSPVKRARLHQTADRAATGMEPVSLELGDDRYDLDVRDEDDEDSPSLPSVPRAPRPVKYSVSDEQLSSFPFLMKSVHKGQEPARLGASVARPDSPRAQDICPRCRREGAKPEYRCQECAGGLLLCSDCCLHRHVDLPLHVIYYWNGIYFQKSSLANLGLRIQMGHVPGEACANPRAADKHFVVLHENGIHEVNVDFCGCENNVDHYIQLLRMGWFPATPEKPKTCATFILLDRFLIETSQAKTTMYDFYGALEKLTNNEGVKPSNRYQSFIRMCRQWRHLMMLKRAGRAHDPGGSAATKSGELAITCPACPDPVVNLPLDWENAPPEKKFLYILFLALDACFCLKRGMVSSELKDAGLGTGWSYMVENGPYREYLLTVTDQKEMSTCSGLAALDYANTKFSRGYTTTGVGMGVCARHEFIQANGVGDLQKGERYANMDYIFGSILRHHHHKLLKTISYDIICQWWKNLLERMKELPPLVRCHLILALLWFVIPKMHIHAHTLMCLLLYSLNLVPGSGQTDGEGIERPWSNIGGIASSTRVMGPGARHDTIDCHWGHWNWQKLIHLATTLRRQLDIARQELQLQKEGFELFSQQQADRVPEWKKMVEEFEADGTKRNPYQGAAVKGLTESEVRLRFTTEEAEEAKRGVPPRHQVSASSFVATALDLEDEQHGVLRTKLNRGIQRLRKLQATYMPAALLALARHNSPPEEQAENVPLFLPSALTRPERESGCVTGVDVIEDLFRDAQCGTSLVQLRSQLHVKARLLNYKKLHARHQGANTRARTIVFRNESKIRLQSEKYQMAWMAKVALAGGEEGSVGWRKLRKEDIRLMEDAEELTRKAEKQKKATVRRMRKEAELRESGEMPPENEDEDAERRARGGENMRQISWIWTEAGISGTDLELEDALRIEWAKAYARMRRWDEEVQLLQEEFRRLPISFEHRAALWMDRARAVELQTMPRELAQGMRAYAERQAKMYRDLAARAKVIELAPKLARGMPRRRAEAEYDALALTGGEEEEEDADEGDEDLEGDGVELEERGDIPSDEEVVMGGEMDDE
ncbi:hypothetical protein B0H13DRAFT_2233210 [Mycena leptocephala]|nr:hypothetical protein B0H13DRAFT_2233210 [Mycena leptocephala]